MMKVSTIYFENGLGPIRLIEKDNSIYVPCRDVAALLKTDSKSIRYYTNTYIGWHHTEYITIKSLTKNQKYENLCLNHIGIRKLSGLGNFNKEQKRYLTRLLDEMIIQTNRLGDNRAVYSCFIKENDIKTDEAEKIEETEEIEESILDKIKNFFRKLVA